MLAKQKKITWANRFRGFLPIVIDVETSGLESATDALLEIAAVTLAMDSHGKLSRDKTYVYQVEPFENARIKFDVRYYLVAILFILFDLEIVFLFPWAVSLNKIGVAGLVAMGIFLGFLVVGFIYEWKKGALEWE